MYFLERNNRSTADALSLHADFVSTFFLPNTTAAPVTAAARQSPTRTLSWPRQQPQPQQQPRRRCEKEVNDELCLWGCFDSDERCVNMLPTGPHTYGSWGVSIPNDQYNQVMPWVFRNNVKYADSIAGILLHPLTADRGADTRLTRKRDHEWGLWAPGRLPLDYDFLDHNVYDCTTCDPELCSCAECKLHKGNAGGAGRALKESVVVALEASMQVGCAMQWGHDCDCDAETCRCKSCRIHGD